MVFSNPLLKEFLYHIGNLTVKKSHANMDFHPIWVEFQSKVFWTLFFLEIIPMTFGSVDRIQIFLDFSPKWHGGKSNYFLWKNIQNIMSLFPFVLGIFSKSSSLENQTKVAALYTVFVRAVYFFKPCIYTVWEPCIQKDKLIVYVWGRGLEWKKYEHLLCIIMHKLL